MTRIEAIRAISSRLTDEIVVHANGHICRESYCVQDRPGNFYMIGSMGMAPAIAMGICLARPHRKVLVYDGDGSVLMSLGNLAMAGSLCPGNLVHIVLDNEAYGSTGEQPTLSRFVDLDSVAAACGYRVVERVDRGEDLESKLEKVLKSEGPCFLLIKLASSDGESCPRVRETPEEIAGRLKNYLRD